MTLQNQVPWNCECGDAGVKRNPHLISLFFVWFEAGSFQFSFLTATPLASIRGSILRSLPHHQTSPSSRLSIRWVWMRLAKLLFMLPLFSPLFLLLVHQSITNPSLPRLFHSPFSSSLLHIALLLVFHFPSSVSSSSLPSPFSSSVSSHLFLISLVFSPVLSVICFPPFVLRPPPFPPHLLAWLYLLFLPPSLSLSQFLPVIPPPLPLLLPLLLHFSDGDVATEEELRDGGGAWLNVPCSKSPGWCPAAFKVSNLVTKGTRRWAGALWERSNC